MGRRSNQLTSSTVYLYKRPLAAAAAVVTAAATAVCYCYFSAEKTREEEMTSRQISRHEVNIHQPYLYYFAISLTIAYWSAFRAGVTYIVVSLIIPNLHIEYVLLFDSCVFSLLLL